MSEMEETKEESKLIELLKDACKNENIIRRALLAGMDIGFGYSNMTRNAEYNDPRIFDILSPEYREWHVLGREAHVEFMMKTFCGGK